MAMIQTLQGLSDKVAPGKPYAIDDALKIVKEGAKAKFNESVDVRREPRHRREEVRPAGARFDRAAARHRQDGARRGVLPPGEKAEAAKAAGADVVGMEDLAEKMQAGDINFGRVIATPGRHARRRQARPDARSARPDAEPERRHGDRRTSPRR